MYKMLIYRDICFILVEWYIDRYVGGIGWFLDVINNFGSWIKNW